MFFVGDGSNDIPAFIETKNGVAVNSKNKELHKVAWKICKNLTEVKKLF